MQQKEQERRGQRDQGCRRGRGKEGYNKGNRRSNQEGAKTFRRMRAIRFLESMYAKRDTLKAQLETPELQSINQSMAGELKAIEMVISEFSQAFDIHEFEDIEESNEQKE